MRVTICTFVIICFLGSSSFAQNSSNPSRKKPLKIPINNDSLSIYSTHPSRPFKYGYAISKIQCEKYYKDLVTDFELKNGDIVADIGAASGWIDGILSVFTDSVTYYVQDINSIYLNEIEFENVMKHYSPLRLNSQTNNFHIIIGTKKKTNLPDIKFDKIIFNNAFHEITFPIQILNDIVGKIKPNGKIIIQEGFSSRQKKHKLPGCGITGYKVQDVIDLLSKFGFYLVKATGPINSFHNCLIFERDIDKSYNFFTSYNDSVIQGCITALDDLYINKTSKDSVKVNNLVRQLKDNFHIINTKFGSLEIHFHCLGNQWMQEGNHKAAFNILNSAMLLYPESYILNAALGDLFQKKKEYKAALRYYTIALNLDDNKFYQRKVAEIKLKIK